MHCSLNHHNLSYLPLLSQPMSYTYRKYEGPVFEMLKDADYRSLTGYPFLLLDSFSRELNIPLFDIFAVAMILHLNLSYGAAAALLVFLGFDVSESTLCRLVSSVCELVKDSRSYRPERRFMVREPKWPQVTALIDGVPVYCRGTAEFHNDKNGQKSVVFQVVVDVAGRPLAWSEGLPGRRTDAVAIDGWEPFVHCKGEFILADSMYIASAHCVTPWKKGASTNVSKMARDNFECAHRKVRARVEHYFARLSRHKWTRGSDFHTSQIPSLFNFQMHMDARYLDMVPPLYGVEVLTESSLSFFPPASRHRCECKFVSLNEIKNEDRPTFQYRNAMIGHQNLNTAEPINLENKRSRNSSKAKPKTYSPRTRQATKAKYALVHAVHKARGLMQNALRKRERKLFYKDFKPMHFTLPVSD